MHHGGKLVFFVSRASFFLSHTEDLINYSFESGIGNNFQSRQIIMVLEMRTHDDSGDENSIERL